MARRSAQTVRHRGFAPPAALLHVQLPWWDPCQGCRINGYSVWDELDYCSCQSRHTDALCYMITCYSTADSLFDALNNQRICLQAPLIDSVIRIRQIRKQINFVERSRILKKIWQLRMMLES